MAFLFFDFICQISIKYYKILKHTGIYGWVTNSIIVDKGLQGHTKN
jgi:hypothetical protein